MRPHLKPLVRRLFDDRRVTAPAAVPADTLTASRPYPDGWFCLAFADEVRHGSVTTRPLAGEEVVLYRTASGVLCAVAPRCPHLGAHLGVGGHVEGEDLVCPFHRFAFDPSGTCVRTGYDQPPPRASVIRHPVREVNGSIYVWRHEHGARPHWEMPEFPMNARQPYSHATFDIAGHPQDVIENAFDWGHLPALHGLRELEIQGVPVAGERTATVTASARGTVLRGSRQSYTLTVIGLGSILARTELPLGAGTLYVMLHATPTGPGRIQVRFGTKLELAGPPGLPAGLGRRAMLPAGRLLSGLLQRVASVDTGADLLMWHHQEHLEQPKLAKGDGPIGRYRQWARQFYSEPATNGASRTSAPHAEVAGA